MLTLDEIKRYYRVKKFAFNVKRAENTVPLSVHCVPNGILGRYGFAPFDRLQLKTGTATLITYQDEFLILEDSSESTAIGINVPPMLAYDHGIKKLEKDDGFVHPAFVPGIRIFDIRKPFFGYAGYEHFPQKLLRCESNLGDLLQERSNMPDPTLYREKLTAQIQRYRVVIDDPHDWPERTICRLRHMQLKNKLQELDKIPVTEMDLRDQAVLEREVIKLFLRLITAPQFFEYVHLKARLSAAEIEVMTEAWRFLDDDLQRRLGNESTVKKVREDIFSRLYIFTQQAPNLTLFDYLLKEGQFDLAYDELQRTRDNPKTDVGRNFLEFYTELGNLKYLGYPQKFFPKASASPDSDLDIFYRTEDLFFGFLKADNRSKDDLKTIGELYSRVGNGNRILFVLSQIRLLQVRTLTEPMTDDLNKLRLYKAQLLEALENAGTPEAFNELLRLYNDHTTPQGVRDKILACFWRKIGQITFPAVAIEIILEKKFTPSKNISGFIDECLKVIETFPADEQIKLKERLQVNYSSDKIKVAHQFYKEKNWNEALRWANFIMQSHVSFPAEILEPYALINADVNPESDIIRNNLRYYIFRHAVDSNDAKKAIFYYQILNIKLLESENQTELSILESDYRDLKYKHLYQLAKDLESFLRCWLPLRSFEYFELYVQFQRLFTKFNCPTTNDSGQQLEEFENALKGIIGSRWFRVQDSRNSYIYDNISPLNYKLTVLASAIDRDRRYHILMPTLEEETDPYSNEIKDLEFGQFILTKDKKQFIHLRTLYSDMVSRIDNGECDRPTFRYRISYSDRRNQETAFTEDYLSDAEVTAMSVLVPLTTRFLATAKERLAAQKMTALRAFQELRAALKRGDISDGKLANDMDAGADSMTAVSNFKDWLESLPSEQQSIIESLPRFIEVKIRLFKTLEQVLSEVESNSLNTNTHDCIQQIGDILDPMIERNKDVLSNITCGTGLVRDAEWTEECRQLLASVGVPRVLPPSPDLLVYEHSKENVLLFTAFSMATHLQVARKRKSSLGDYYHLWDALNHLIDNYIIRSPFEFKHTLMQLKTKLMYTCLSDKPIQDEGSVAAYTASDKKIFQAIIQHNAFRKENKDIYFSLLKDPEGSTYYSLKDGVIHCHIGVGSRERRTTLEGEIFVDYISPQTPFYILDKGTPIYFSNLNQAATEFKLIHLLAKSTFAPTFDSFKVSIDHPANPPKLKSSLLNLRTTLVNEAFSGKPSAESKITKVVTEVNRMISGIHESEDNSAKAQFFVKCKKELVGESWLDSPFAKAVKPVLTAVVNIIRGLVSVTPLGAWLGPGLDIYKTVSFWQPPSVDQSVINACEAAEYASHIAVSP